MISSSAYSALALSCLVRWGIPEPLSRIDVFSGGYFALRILGSIHSVVSSRSAFDSKQVRREWWALTSDPGGPRWVVLLMLADLAVFLDYGHWRLFPALEQPMLQGLGIGLYVGVTMWQMWTDTYLARHFGQAQPKSVPMDEGPYRYMRHPRYAAAIAGKVAFALVFASVLAWPLALAWSVMLFRKVGVEEAHLQTLFGPEYEAYAERTAKLLPGIY